MRPIAIAILCWVVASNLYGQSKNLLFNKNFEWGVDSSSKALIIYYQPERWASTRIDHVRDRILNHINSVEAFVQISNYQPVIHYFIVDSREEMKKLIGWESSGRAFYKTNTVCAIASDKLQSTFSNHEIFHVVAMNSWGVPERWINEGMAVYADGGWNGYDLYQLTKYLKENGRMINLEKLIRKFKRQDSTLSYPLIASFVKFVGEKYGREVILKIWKNGFSGLTKATGKSISELEKEWLSRIQLENYKEIKY